MKHKIQIVDKYIEDNWFYFNDLGLDHEEIITQIENNLYLFNSASNYAERHYGEDKTPWDYID
tara:strand:- start:21602 stop:21790 length:189 start_codon:yes stop_codon:yes gene_type:complete